MIFDTISRFECFRIFRPEVEQKILEKLVSLTPDLPDGRIEIDGDRIYATLATYTTKPMADAMVEAHRDYCDIQLLLAGEEDIYLSDVEDLPVTVPYKPDIIFYGQQGAEWSSIRLVPRKFAVFFPNEGHMPGIVAAGKKPCSVRKFVFKVAASLLLEK